MPPNQIAGFTPQAVDVQRPQQSWGDYLKELFMGRQGGLQAVPQNDPGRQSIFDQLAQLGFQGVNQQDQYGPMLQNLIANNNGASGSQNLTPGIVGMALQGLQNPYQGFQPIANQATRQFETQTIPSLAERFTSLGTGGSQRSSAFQGALGNAASDLSGNLASMQSQYGLQNRGLLQSLLGLGANYQQNRESQLQSLLGMGAQYNQNRQGQYQNLLNTGLQPSFQYANQGGSTGLLPRAANLASQVGVNYALGSIPGAAASVMPNLSVQQLMDNNSLLGAQNSQQTRRLGGGY